MFAEHVIFRPRWLLTLQAEVIKLGRDGTGKGKEERREPGQQIRGK